MNAMTSALRVAGTKLPTMRYRIWNWLKDHPEKTADDVMKALGLTYVPSTLLVQMERDKQVRVYSDVTKRVNPVTKRPQKIKRFSAAPTYEAPMRKKHERRTVVAETQIVAPLSVNTFDPETFTQKLSLSQCKALYTFLYGVFR